MGHARPLRIILAKPRGFCAGVVRAIEIVEKALRLYGAPVYVRHEIVHNSHVVASLKARGAIFVDEVDSIPEGALTVFSAHGVSPTVEQAAAQRRLDVIDATCPLVQKVHNEGRRYARRGFDVILIGHEGHAEVEGTRGQVGGRLHVVGSSEDVERLCVSDPQRVAYVTQTTLSLSDANDVIGAIKRRFPDVIGPETRDICYATQNRQNAVVELARHAQLILVVGSPNSSNSNRLREIAQASGVAAHLIDSVADLDPAWLDGVSTLGLTAGASAPESLVIDTVDAIAEWRAVSVETMQGLEETVQFKLPPRVEEAVLHNG